ncbi:MAG TPA: hypothetical protein VGM90_34775 [Kofleriaceae bacterium]|jgi:hypothetical protein
MHHNQTRNSNGNNGRNRGDHGSPGVDAQRGEDEHVFDTASDLRDDRYMQRHSFGGYNDRGRSFEDAREFNGGRAADGGFIGENDARPVMASRYGYDDDRRFGPRGHQPQRFDHDRDDGRWGRDHDYDPNYHHHHSYTRGYDAAMRDIARRDPRRDDPRAGRSAFEPPFDERRRR